MPEGSDLVTLCPGTQREKKKKERFIQKSRSHCGSEAGDIVVRGTGGPRGKGHRPKTLKKRELTLAFSEGGKKSGVGGQAGF